MLPLPLAQDSEPSGAVVIGDNVRPVEELKTAMLRGSKLRKYGRRGKPKDYVFRISQDLQQLQWGDGATDKPRSVRLADVVRIQQGQDTPTFRRCPAPEFHSLSLSVIYTECGNGSRGAIAGGITIGGFASSSGGGGGGKERSLDLICRNAAEFEVWFWGLRLYSDWARGAAYASLRSLSMSEGGTTPVPTVASGRLERVPRTAEEKPTDIKSKAASVLQAPLAPLAAARSASGPVAGATTTPGLPSSQAVAQGRVSGVLGFPARREIGDCYIWGAWSSGSASAKSSSALNGCVGTMDSGFGTSSGWGDVAVARQQGSSSHPVLLQNTHLDVTHVAAGAQHAALLTRGGEIYTWGSGAGGRLGHGTTASAVAPQQVSRLLGKGTVGVACGHTYTAAVLRDGALYTWGHGLGGQLGLGDGSSFCTTQLWPARVLFGSCSTRVTQISCGPYHLAAVSQTGALYTWGDGMFGKLGHGGHDCCSSPRVVEALRGSRVLGASCGWWHTAAVAVPPEDTSQQRRRTNVRAAHSGVALASTDARGGRSGTSDGGGDSGDSGLLLGGWPSVLSNDRGEAATPVWGSGSCEDCSGGQVGGALYTWGGDFTWQLHGKRDHHQGCLGHGDLEGRLLPTQVMGEDDVRQVVCGRNFTVAVNGIGQVLQMGSTGAANPKEPRALWEGARMPVIVGGPLAGMRAELAATGESHVVVLCSLRPRAGSQRSHPGPQPPGGSDGHGRAQPPQRQLSAGEAEAPAYRLVAWGVNSHGQLGVGSLDSFNVPQFVAGINGRRVLHISAGATFSMAVCEHNPREAAARWSRESEDDFSRSMGAPAVAPLAAASPSSAPDTVARQLLGSSGVAGNASSASLGALAGSIGAAISSGSFSGPPLSRGAEGPLGGSTLMGNALSRSLDRARPAELAAALMSRFSDRGAGAGLERGPFGGARGCGGGGADQKMTLCASPSSGSFRKAPSFNLGGTSNSDRSISSFVLERASASGNGMVAVSSDSNLQVLQRQLSSLAVRSRIARQLRHLKTVATGGAVNRSRREQQQQQQEQQQQQTPGAARVGTRAAFLLGMRRTPTGGLMGPPVAPRSEPDLACLSICSSFTSTASVSPLQMPLGDGSLTAAGATSPTPTMTATACGLHPWASSPAHGPYSPPQQCLHHNRSDDGIAASSSSAALRVLPSPLTLPLSPSLPGGGGCSSTASQGAGGESYWRDRAAQLEVLLAERQQEIAALKTQLAAEAGDDVSLASPGGACHAAGAGTQLGTSERLPRQLDWEQREEQDQDRWQGAHAQARRCHQLAASGSGGGGVAGGRGFQHLAQPLSGGSLPPIPPLRPSDIPSPNAKRGTATSPRAVSREPAFMWRSSTSSSGKVVCHSSPPPQGLPVSPRAALNPSTPESAAAAGIEAEQSVATPSAVLPSLAAAAAAAAAAPSAAAVAASPVSANAATDPGMASPTGEALVRLAGRLPRAFDPFICGTSLSASVSTSYSGCPISPPPSSPVLRASRASLGGAFAAALTSWQTRSSGIVGTQSLLSPDSSHEQQPQEQQNQQQEEFGSAVDVAHNGGNIGGDHPVLRNMLPVHQAAEVGGSSDEPLDPRFSDAHSPAAPSCDLERRQLQRQSGGPLQHVCQGPSSVAPGQHASWSNVPDLVALPGQQLDFAQDSWQDAQQPDGKQLFEQQEGSPGLAQEQAVHRFEEERQQQDQWQQRPALHLGLEDLGSISPKWPGPPSPPLRSGTIPSTARSWAQHRRALSADIGAFTSGCLVTREVTPGVYVSLQQHTKGGSAYELRCVRFDKQVFSAAEAEAWWAANRGSVMQRYGLMVTSGSEQHLPRLHRQRTPTSTPPDGSTGASQQQAMLEGTGQPSSWEADVGGQRSSSSSADSGAGEGGGEAFAGGWNPRAHPLKLRPELHGRKLLAQGGPASGKFISLKASSPAVGTPTISSPACSTFDLDPSRSSPTMSAAHAAAMAGALTAERGREDGDSPVMSCDMASNSNWATPSPPSGGCNEDASGQACPQSVHCDHGDQKETTALAVVAPLGRHAPQRSDTIAKQDPSAAVQQGLHDPSAQLRLFSSSGSSSSSPVNQGRSIFSLFSTCHSRATRVSSINKR